MKPTKPVPRTVISEGKAEIYDEKGVLRVRIGNLT